MARSESLLMICGVSALAEVKVFDYPEYKIYAFQDVQNRFTATLFEFNTEVVPKIKALKFAGHTQGHTVYQLENCFFAGDIVHAAELQIAHPAFCARYDKNPADAVTSRKRALSVLKGEWFCTHIPFPGRFINPPPQLCFEHVALDVAAPESTAKWWCENLGFHIAAKLPVPPYAIFIVNSSGNFAMELYRTPNTPNAPNYSAMSPDKMHIAFMSDDVNGDIQRLTVAGAKFVSRTKIAGNELVMLRDPSGIPVQLVKRAVPLFKSDSGLFGKGSVPYEGR